MKVISFTLQTNTILQYAYNIFASVLPVLYLYGGAAFAAFILGKLLAVLK